MPLADPEPLRWSGRLSLTQRILAVNVIAVLMLAGSFFYLDGFRSRLIDERVAQANAEARLIALAVSDSAAERRDALIDAIGQQTGMRVRLLDGRNRIVSDSWQANGPSFALRDPARENWQRRVAAGLDDAIDTIVGADVPPSFRGLSIPSGERVSFSLAPDRTHILTTRALVPGWTGASIVTHRNDREIRRLVRAERSRLGGIIGIATLISVLLSLFLARTIARPLRLLAEAAMRVRLGRARDVVVPRLPSRSDEIGTLARAVSDMNRVLHERLDATEAFAADVAHELKNPLASLSSAAESLDTVEQPELKAQLKAIIREDVRRLDRLITDISDLSRIDAELARARFETIDLGQMIEALIATRTARQPEIAARIAFARPLIGSTRVRGDPARLTRVVDNLLDNAFSFSPPAGIVTIGAARSGARVRLTVEDEGPGIAPDLRSAVFGRFHSDRPESEAFGTHSGLGLAIAKTIVEAHDGTIEVQKRSNGQSGARFLICLQAAA